MAGWSTLVQPEPLAIALRRRDVVVMDCRHALDDTEAGVRAWMYAHIPGAQFAHMDRDLSARTHVPGAGRHPWPAAEEFVARLGRWGIGADTQVIAYDDADGAFAARLWFLLRALGHDKVAVLDGGWRRWLSLALPTSSASHVQHQAVDYPLRDYEPGRVLDTDAMKRRMQEGALLLDARAAVRFRGDEEPIDNVAGHVPGAVNRPYAENLDGVRFKSPAALAAEFRELLGGQRPSDVIAMCGSGVTACHHLLALERAGMYGASLYAGSWSGWIADPGNPVARGAEG